MVVLVESRSRQTSHGDYDKSQLLFWGLLSVFEPTCVCVCVCVCVHVCVCVCACACVCVHLQVYCLQES